MKKPKADSRFPNRRQAGLLGGAGIICLLLSALCRFVLPGVRFSGTLFFCLSILCGLLLALRFWADRSKKGRLCCRIVYGGLCVGLAAFLAVEGVILFYGERRPPETPADAVIVLGAGVNGTVPSLTLRTRINAAAAYLKAHPGVPAVLSGGQGPGEDITEAKAMYDALVGEGIPPERLLLEERSTSTEENLLFSREILLTAGVPADGTVAIVTNDFHQYRAQLIARELGMQVTGIAAELPWWWLNANYYIREFFALGKFWLITLVA